LRKLEWKVFLRAQYTLDYDTCRSSWIGDYNDPNTFLDMFMSNNGNNRTGWKNERYDELMRRANVLTDVQERMKLLQAAETILVRDEAPIVPLYFYVGINYFDSNRVRGIFFNIRDEHPIRTIRKLKPGSYAASGGSSLFSVELGARNCETVARPHSGPLRQEREKRFPPLCDVIMPGRRPHFEANDSSAATASKLKDLTSNAALLSLSLGALGERVGVRASVHAFQPPQPFTVCDPRKTAKNPTLRRSNTNSCIFSNAYFFWCL
jgi:hypothetical protein